MGVMTPPGGSGEEPNGTITTRPKERQFQVVPVPGVFTRGRWKCCDFREAELIDKGILEFVKPNADVANHNPSTIMVTSVAPVRVETLQKQAQSTPVLAPSLPADASLDSIHSEQASSTLTGLSVADTTTDSVGSSTQPASLTTELPVPAVEVPRHASSTTVNIPVTHKPEFDETNDVSVSQNIDNKIEQAMDLVKSHLTFAVREEVEDLKGTISQLKSKIQLLESQNIILRQFAPSDVVKNLPALIQSQQIPPLKSEPIKERSSRTFVPAQINPIESDQSVPITQQPSLPLPTMSSPSNIDSSSLEPQTLPATSFPSRSICESQPPLPLSSGTSESSTPIDVTQRGSDMVPTQTPHQFLPPSQNTAGISRQYSYPDQSVAAPVQQQFSSPVLESQTLPPQYPPKHNTSDRVNAQPS